MGEGAQLLPQPSLLTQIQQEFPQDGESVRARAGRLYLESLLIAFKSVQNFPKRGHEEQSELQEANMKGNRKMSE